MTKTIWTTGLLAMLCLAASAPAYAGCYDAATYRDAELELDALPTARERAAMSPRLASAYDDLEDATRDFLATERSPCSVALPAIQRQIDAIFLVIDTIGPKGTYCCPDWDSHSGGTGACYSTDGDCYPGDFACTPNAEGKCE